MTTRDKVLRMLWQSGNLFLRGGDRPGTAGVQGGSLEGREDSPAGGLCH